MSPFQSKAFCLLFTAQITSLVGTGLSSIALALLAWQMAGEQAGIVVSIALALKMVAYIFIAPVIGGLAHRMPRKRVLISLDIVRAVLIGCLPWVNEIWQIYVLMFAINACAAGFTPLFQATIPALFNHDQVYSKALSYARLAYDLENLLSPTLAAILLAWVGFNQLFYANGLTFIVSALLISFALFPVIKAHDRPPQIWHNIQFGINAYLHTPRLRALWALYFAVAAAGGMVIVNSVIYVQSYFKLDQQTLALLLMASGAGSMLAALGVPYLRNYFADRSIMLAGGLLLGLALSLGVFMLPLAGVYMLWLCLGMGSSLVQTPAGNLVRRSSHDSDSAALFAANFSLSHLAWLVGYLLAGWLGNLMGLNWAFVVLAGMAWVALLLAWQQYPKQDEAALWHTHAAMDHVHPHQHDQHHEHGHHQHGEVDKHMHQHHHKPIRHKHTFIIDQHHPRWPDHES